MADIMVVAVVLVIVGLASAYIIKAKKKGVKCIGCPAAGECSRMNGTASGCSCGNSEESSCACHSDTKE